MFGKGPPHAGIFLPDDFQHPPDPLPVPFAFSLHRALDKTHVGPFQILDQLGTNRRQRVYHARHVQQGRDVALKFIALPPKVDRARAIDKINIEVDILKQLKHPNLVRLYGAGIDGDQIFLVSELVAGESLTALLARRGRLSPDLVVEIGRQIAEVLDYLHQQEVLHCKLTPDKILIDERHQVKVADLRLNRSRRKRWDTGRKRELDLAAYMAPEQFGEGATNKSDIYALGVLLFEMLTGRLPYEPDTMGRLTRKKLHDEPPSVAQYVISCPHWLDQLVRQMLAPDPRNRPHSARAVVLALSEIQNVDQSKRAAVAQVTGHFNPLTAGVDKTEANRLLGRKPKKEDDGTPFYEKVPFLVGCLIVIAAIVGYALVPTPSRKLMARAQVLMESDDSSDWFRAREPLRTVLERGPEGEFYDQAKELFTESRRRTLVAWAEEGRSLWTQSENAKQFAAAVQSQMAGDLDKAKQGFERLLKIGDPNGDERHIWLESQHRLEQLVQATALPTDRGELLGLVERLGQVESKEELQAAKRQLTEILFQHAGQPEYQDVLDAAQAAINMVRQRLERGDTDSPDDSASHPSEPETTDSSQPDR